MGGAVGAAAGETALVDAEEGIELVDFEGVLADEPGAEGEDLLLDGDTGGAVGFGDAVGAVVGGDFDEDVGAVALDHHGLEVGDFVAGGGGLGEGDEGESGEE